MSETFGTTRASFRRLRTALENADEDTRYAFAFWVSSLLMMGGSIIAQFGWNGAIFCAGLVLWAAGKGGSNQ